MHEEITIQSSSSAGESESMPDYEQISSFSLQ